MKPGKTEQQSASPSYGAFDPQSMGYRYFVLFLICMVTFGSYFSYDTPGASVAQLLDKDSKLHMSALQYNLLYSLYAWPNVIIVFVGGYFIDFLGPNLSGIVLMSLVTVGQIIMTIGAVIPLMWLVFFGRLVFASGAELLIVCQGAMIFKWFKGKELALAFGFSLTFARLGTIINFAVLPSLSQAHGVAAAFGYGAIFCCISYTFLLLFLVLDHHADSLSQKAEKLNESDVASEDPGLNGIMDLSASFWLCVATLTTNYGTIYSFLAVAIDFMTSYFGISTKIAGYQISSVYNISMITAPIVGYILDNHGARGIVTFVGAVLNAVLFCGLGWACAFGSFHPPDYVAAVMVSTLAGFSLALLSASVWATIPIIVSPSQVAMAIGVAQALQNFGVGISTLGVGYIYDNEESYAPVLIYLAGIAIASVLFGAAWNVQDFLYDGRVNRAEVLGPEEQGLLEQQRKILVVQAVLVVRRKFYEDIGEGEIGMKRRDYYRSIGIHDFAHDNDRKPIEVGFTAPLLQKRTTASLKVPDSADLALADDADPNMSGSGRSDNGHRESLPQYGSGRSDNGLREALLQYGSGRSDSGLREALLLKSSRRDSSAMLKEAV